MESLILNLAYTLLFVCLLNRIPLVEYKQLYIRVRKNAGILALVFIFSSVLFVAPSYAGAAGVPDTGLFADLINKGSEIFRGVRDIVFVVAGFGIIGVAVGGFFGNMNWKWLSAIIIGLVIVGLTGSVIQFVAGDSAGALKNKITNSLI